MKSPRVFIDFLPNQHGRNIVAGICEHLRRGRVWETVLRYENLRHKWPDLGRAGIDGFIGPVQTQAQLRALDVLGPRAVNVARVLPDVPLACVYSDNWAAGRMAARHFAERGYRHFAYLGPDGIAYSHDRLAGFKEELRSYNTSAAELLVGAQRFNEDRLRPHETRIRRWLESIARPFGLFCCNDFFARYCLEVIRQRGWHVPGDVAILGVNNDLVYCEMATIPLSSIELNGLGQGLRAAELLDEILQGSFPAAPIWIPPSRVVVRQSTDGLAITDQVVATALRLIRAQAFGNVEMEKVARTTGVSRRVLELRFRKAVGCSPYAEVLRVRFERARELLTTTSLTLQQIAEHVGFQEARELHALFRTRAAMSPGEYRERYTFLHEGPRVSAMSAPARAKIPSKKRGST